MGVRPEPLSERNGFGVYQVADVDRLYRLYRQAVRENAELCRESDRRRRDSAYEEKDLDWMGD